MASCNDHLCIIVFPPTYSDLELGNNRWEGYLAREGSPIADIFVGQFKSTIQCTQCGYTSACFDPFWDIGLPIYRVSNANLLG